MALGRDGHGTLAEGPEQRRLADELDRVTNKLCKWRAVFAGWWFGTRPDSAPDAKAARDNFDRTIMLRCEVNALTALLIARGVFTAEDFTRQLIDEVKYQDRALEQQWPGLRTDESGVVFTDLQLALRTLNSKGVPA